MNPSLKFANQQGYTDVRPYEVIKVISDKCIEVRAMDSVETEESREARIKSFQPGGFFGHTDNSVQRYTFASNESYPIKRIRLGKSEENNITVILNEESYTSKCDSLALESLCKQESYLGKRVKRGLFQSSTKKLINADVNGSINILRKVIGDDFIQNLTNRGLVFNPVKVNPLQSFICV